MSASANWSSPPTLVAGVDSSTQACKVVIVEAATGQVVRSGRAQHPPGTEVDPEEWWDALQLALQRAGGLDDVSALAVAGQQHGMVCLDDAGDVVRPALLWNDTRSAQAAAALTREWGGGQAWASRTGVVPVASFTLTKLRWLAHHEPASAARVAAVCLPHDYLTWRLAGGASIASLTTDRSDASGTAYWSAVTGAYDRELLMSGLGRDLVVPQVAGPAEAVGQVEATEILLGPGCGDNAGAALGLGAETGDVIVSLGTSGVATAVSQTPARDASGIVAGFADATGRYLPLIATLNGARTLDAAATLLGTDHGGLAELALHGPPGADGLCLVPYLEGERTPNLPLATGALHGLTLATMSPAHLARATVEGLWCGLADGIEALEGQGAESKRVIFIGGAAASQAVCEIGPTITGLPTDVPHPSEYVALGAARQAAWVLSSEAAPPPWPRALGQVARYDPDDKVALRARIRSRYAEARGHHLNRL